MTFDSWPSCLHLLRAGIPGLCTRLRPPHNVPCRFSQKKKKKLFLKLVSIELNFSIGKYCFSFIMGRLTRRYMLGTFNLHPKNKRLFPLIYCHLFLSIKLQHSNLNSQIEMHYPNWQAWESLFTMSGALWSLDYTLSPWKHLDYSPASSMLMEL